MSKARRWKRNFAISIAFGCVLLSAQWATAAGVILQTGFESPFVPGALNGQQGWKRADIGNSSSTAIVENAVGTSGSPAVRLTRGASSDTRWGLISQPFPSQRYVIVDWDMTVTQAPTNQGVGPFLGMDCYDRNPSNTPFVLGSLGVDATTGDVLTQLQDSGFLVDTGAVVQFNQFNHFRLVFDFLNDTYTGLVNGAVVSTTGFVDRQFGLNDFTDADITAFGAAADAVSQSNTASAIFDNYLVRDGLLGDYDIDGDVDQGDYARWRALFGTAVTPGNHADGNRNGVVDAADWVVWRENLGASIFGSPGVGSFVVAAVPEPASGMLGLLGLSAILCATSTRSRNR
jgi:hypothetical protein